MKPEKLGMIEAVRNVFLRALPKLLWVLFFFSFYELAKLSISFPIDNIIDFTPATLMLMILNFNLVMLTFVVIIIGLIMYYKGDLNGSRKND